MNNKVVLFLSIITACCSSTVTNLYLYGQPTFTLNSGFIKIDPQTNAWEEAATGFATTVLAPIDAFCGVVFNSKGSALFYGNFLYWTDVYVGGILCMNTSTLDMSPFNSGVLGNGVTGITYYDDDQKVALIGDFTGVQQNPQSLVGQVATCTSDGVSCVPLGSGLDSYFDEGRIISVKDVLYALYMDTYTSARIAMFNISREDSTESWETIYTMPFYKWSQSPIQITEYLGALWIFGNVTLPNNFSVGAARWDLESGVWEYIATSHYPGNQQLGADSKVVISVSPNGEDVYMTFRDVTTSNSGVYKWNGTLGDWTLFAEDMCPTDPTIAALDNGVLYGCAPTVEMFLVDATADGPLPELQCEASWLSLTVRGELLYAFCNEEAYTRIFLYNLTLHNTTLESTVEDLEAVILNLVSMCVYGSKIVAGGAFERVGGAESDRIALWNSKYNKWTAFMMPIPTACWCATDGNMMAAACTLKDPNKVPIMIVDWADTDTGDGYFVENVQMYNLTELHVTKFFSGVLLNNSIVYLTCFDSQGHVYIYSWTAAGGLSKIVNVTGFPFNGFAMVDSILFVGSQLFYINDTPVNTAMYDLNAQEWLPMDQLESDSLIITDMLFWSYTDEVYVAGQFDWAGSMRVSNWAGYSTLGQAVDAVAGGMPNRVSQLQPIDDRMYLTSYENCPLTVSTACNMLLYYDPAEQSYSYKITTGIGFITAGVENSGDDGGSSSTDSLFNHWWGWISVVVAGVVLASCVALASFLFSRQIWKKGQKHYQEISDILSVESVEIDYQTEPFELKSVLGRGSIGTVWSCVFPKKESATYGNSGRTLLIYQAVKQMLFSKGDIQLIELVKKEIEILEKLRHPRIVHYCGYRSETSTTSVEFFIFMELYEKPCSLDGVIRKKLKEAAKQGRKKWFSFEEVRKFMRQIAEGLEYLHSQGIAHRDLKCANLLVRTSSPTVVNSVHIADFGISKVIRSEQVGAVANTVLGTLSFMAPGMLHYVIMTNPSEIIRRQPYNPFKADIWSFAMLSYEILTWHAPELPGLKPEFDEEVHSYLNSDTRFKTVLDIFDECAQMNPDSRPSAAEVLMHCDNM